MDDSKPNAFDTNRPHIMANQTSSSAHRVPQALLKHKRRYCKVEGCTKIVKSQGLCQRHGAKPKMCRVLGCTKQAQGNFDGMCKSHFRTHSQTPAAAKKPPTVQEEETVESVYCTIIPQSIRHKPSPTTSMPLTHYLMKNSYRGTAWHRNDERHARGLAPVDDPDIPLEAWERHLIGTEILLLAGTPHSSYKQLAKAWGCSDREFPHGFGLSLGLAPDDPKPSTITVDYSKVNNSIWDDVSLESSDEEEALAADLFSI